ncbi:MAG: aspartate-semialdehyde dehydrogenase [Firmicutes bacterium]|nr:aspartate-semialdehyde dehydrogenase [Bacillota bacterium]
MSGYRVAVVGAPGAVGSRVLRVLEERRFPVRVLRALGSERSAGSRVRFAGEELPVERASAAALDGIDLAFFAVGDAVSRELAPEARRRGAVVVDKSNAFRMEPDVPLVVPEVNADALEGHRGLVASPNCSTIQLVVALAPLHREAGLRSVTVATYQAVSGSGAEAMEELRRQAEGYLAGDEPPPGVYPHPIAFNVLPQCDRFLDDGSTREEMKLVLEPRKILGLPELAVAATAVRVPVFIGHSEAVWAEFERPLSVVRAREILASAPGVALRDDPQAGVYPTPREAAERDEVLVGRLRPDPVRPHGLSLWIVADNLRKGAATNAVQIAEALVERGLL